MNFTPGALIAGMLFGSIGLWLFIVAKKRNNLPVLVIGIVMMIYPYFIESVGALWVIGAALCWAAKEKWE